MSDQEMNRLDRASGVLTDMIEVGHRSDKVTTGATTSVLGPSGCGIAHTNQPLVQGEIVMSWKCLSMCLLLALAAVPVAAWGQAPLGTAFTYQGQLKQGGLPADGTYDLVFRLFDAESGPAQVGGEVVIDDWPIVNGLFSVQLDFGAGVFTGDALWIEVAVRPGESSDVHTTLSPRQPLTAAPYAWYALSGPGGEGPWLVSGDHIYNTNAGNVGIGITSPASMLHVSGQVRTSVYQQGDVTVGDASSNGLGMAVRMVEMHLPPDPAEFFNADICYDGSRLSLLTGTTSADPSPGNGLVITNNGWVGIGTRFPGAHLTVAGVIQSTSGGIKFPDGTVQDTAADDVLWQANGSDVYYDSGNVGIGYDSPNRKLYILEDTPGIAFPLKLDNPHPTMGEDGVGILFSTGGSGGGLISPTRGKGALVYEYTDTWNRGSFHFLQNPDTGYANPTLPDSVMTITYSGNVGIGTSDPAGELALGAYQGGTEGSLIESYEKQLVLGGDYNTGVNTGESVKLLISEYDNDPGSDVYPIYVEDENNWAHFYLRSLGTIRRTFFGGEVGIGTNLPSNPLSVAGDADFSGHVGIGDVGADDPNAALHVIGDDNDGTRAALKISTPTANMLLDANEIDTDDASGLFLNRNSAFDVNIASGGGDVKIASGGGEVNIATGGGDVGIGTNSPGAKLEVLAAGGTSVKATGATTGIDAWGTAEGGVFGDSDGSGYARLGAGDFGIRAKGDEAGAFFYQGDGSAAKAWLGYLDDEGRAWGIWSVGNRAGGRCLTPDEGGDARLAYSQPNGHVHGVWARGQIGAYFEDHWGTDLVCASGPSSTSGNGEKNFVQNHPYEDDRIIKYASLEGDEVGTYTRGTARLVAGEARVPLGETFKWVTNPDIGLTAHLTPRGECEGLFVESLTTSEIVVRELHGGRSDVVFDYIVHGLRIGFEESGVVQEKTRQAYIPSMHSVRARYEQYPELRHYTPLERFKRMRERHGALTPVDLTAAHALRDAIEEFDPAIHSLDHREDLRSSAGALPPAREDQGTDGIELQENTDAVTVDHAAPSDEHAAREITGQREAGLMIQEEEISRLRSRLERLEAVLAELASANDGGDQ